ncbi:MAG: DUF4012 domain-containing protein [Candidatus Pacebacteria bacterium]|nr:DUF4012 domain-containing protein [Candidatus Paceibacterota bacterium]
MSPSAQGRRFITEVIASPTPLVVFGGETPLKKQIIEEITNHHDGFIGISDERMVQGFEETPYRVIWVMSGEEDWEKACIYGIQRGVIVTACVLGSRGKELGLEIHKTYPQTSVFYIQAESGDEKNVAKDVVRYVFSDKRGGVERNIGREGEFSRQLKDKEDDTDKNELDRRQEPQLIKKREVIHHEPIRVKPIVQTRILERSKPLQSLFSHLPEEKIFQDIPYTHKRTDQEKGVGERLNNIFSSSHAQPAQKVREEKKIRVKEPWKNSKIPGAKTKKIVVWSGVFMSILCIPFLIFGFLRMSVIRYTRQLYESLGQAGGVGMSLSQDNSILLHTKTAVSFYAIGVQVVDSFLSPLGFATEMEQPKNVVSLANRGMTAIESERKMIELLTRTYAAVTQNSSEDPITLLDTASSQIEQTSKDLALFSSELARGGEHLPLLPQTRAADLEKNVGGTRKALVKLQHLLSVLPDILGDKQKKNYLILIQNPLELRSSGGFLESFAVLTFDRGRLLDVQVRDVAEADNLLKGKVDPPQDLQDYLGETQWFFRDSNWSPQFPSIARQAEWFIEKEMGRKVDGTVAINAFVLQDLLRATGPVTLQSQQNEEITADNMIERMFVKSETLFQSGDQHKRGYLSSVADAVFQSLQKQDAVGAKKVGSALYAALDSGNMIVSLRDPGIEQTFSLLGINGGVMTPPCPQAFTETSCVVDTIYQVDSNVGINRANYYLQRYAEHNVVLSSSTAVHALTLHYSNTSPSTAWPAGTYKNYVRLLIPDFTQLNSVVIDKQPLSSMRIAQDIRYGKREVGFVMEVPVGKTVDVQVNYVTLFTQQAPFSYALFTQKQPGTGEDSVSFSLNIQKPLRTTKLAPEGAVAGNIIQFDATMDRHQYLAVEVR